MVSPKRQSPRRSRTQLTTLVQALRTGLQGGLIAGVYLGVSSRLVMRAIALADGRNAEFSVEGTVGILVTGSIIGLLSGLVFILLRRRLPMSRGWIGPAFGVFVLLLLLPILPPAIRQELADVTTSIQRLSIFLFTLTFAVFGSVLARSVAWFSSRR